MSGLTVRYGGLTAVHNLNLEVSPGQIVGLIGPNGAGKTTAIDAMCGFGPARGSVELDSREMNSDPPHVRARLGIARTFQSLELFDELSAAENVRVAMHRGSLRAALSDLLMPSRTDTSAVRRALDLSSLGGVTEDPVRALSQGQRRLVGLARALVSDPVVALLDEPASGLDTVESQALGRTLRAVASGGTGILLVDHDMSLVLDVCDYVYVLNFGELIWQGLPADVRSDPNVVSAYLGTKRPARSQ